MSQSKDWLRKTLTPREDVTFEPFPTLPDHENITLLIEEAPSYDSGEPFEDLEKGISDEEFKKISTTGTWESSTPYSLEVMTMKLRLLLASSGGLVIAFLCSGAYAYNRDSVAWILCSGTSMGLFTGALIFTYLTERNNMQW